MKVCFALIAHGDPRSVERLARLFLAQGHTVAIHYDLKSPAAAYDSLVRSLAGNSSVRFARRVKVGWGEWSVVQAVLNCLDQIQQAGWEPDYVFQCSGLDYPIRPSEQLCAFLSRNRGEEFIESVPSDKVQWVKTGPQRERYEYRWYFNWRSQIRLTETSLAVQKALRLKRKFVRGFVPHMGSQWWVLTWSTLQQIMKLAREPDIIKFFRTTLVPDELFFQTLVRHLVPEERIVSCSLTFYQFSDYGYPIVYYQDHVDYLVRQPFFMARKLSAHDDCLRDRLEKYWNGQIPLQPFNDTEVGIVSAEYEDWRVGHRNGAPGLRTVGRSAGRWHDDLKRLTKPFFAVLGTSTADLRLIDKALSWHSGLLCHGQLFHPTLIEFGDKLTEFAGYTSKDVLIRAVSAPNFVADIVRCEKRRMSGFLLRRGQGWHIPEVMVDRPNVRVVIVSGDPLVSFSENFQRLEPQLDEPFDPDTLKQLPPAALVFRFRRFLEEYAQHQSWLQNLAAKGTTAKPRGWIVTLNLGGAGGVSRWLASLQSSLGVDLSGAPETADVKALTKELALLQERRDLVIELLLKGGIERIVLDTLQREPDNLAVTLSLL